MTDSHENDVTGGELMVEDVDCDKRDNFESENSNRIGVDGIAGCENVSMYENDNERRRNNNIDVQEEPFQMLSKDDETFTLGLDEDSFQQKDVIDEMEISTSDDCKGKGEYFIVSTLDEVKNLIHEYCERTSSHFVVQKKTKDFGASEALASMSGHRIQWHDVKLAKYGEEDCQEKMIEFDGIPHVILGHYQLNCQFGFDSSASQKQKRKKMKEDGEINVKTRNQKTPSKKCGCPARIVVKQIIRFPQFKILKDTHRRKTTNSARLKEQFKKNRSEIVMEVSYIGRLADMTEHKFHDLIQGDGFSKEEVHRDLIIKAQELYLQNHSIDQIIESLNSHVIDEMFWEKEPPDPRRRRYYPAKKDVLNFITRIRNLSRFTDDEEEKIHTIVDEIKVAEKKDKVAFDLSEEIISECVKGESDSQYDEFFEPDTTDKEKRKKEDRKVQTFVFCFQTAFQQRLMMMYSNITYLMELETDVPLKSTLTYRCYLMLVQTNVDYQVTGFIAVSKQKKNGLAEALKVFKEWNSNWNPKYMFLDCTETMFDAVSVTFPDARQFLNLHSCEDKWMEFVNTRSNDVQQYTEEILGYLRGMQYSLTEEALSNAASLLEGSDVWRNSEKLRRWFQEKWLHLAKCWVFGYRPEDLLVTYHLNFTAVDGITAYREAFNNSVKGDGFVEVVEKVFLNISQLEHKRYLTRNEEHHHYYHQYKKNCTISMGLQGIPLSILPYADCMHGLLQKKQFHVTEDKLGLFSITCDVSHGIHEKGSDSLRIKGSGDSDIKSFETDFSSIRYLNENESGNFTVSFGDSSTFPFCSCSYWNTYKLPCVHMIAIFCKIPGWTFHMLSPLYRYNPVLNIDYSSINTLVHIDTNDVGCQSTCMNNSVGTQINETPMKNSVGTQINGTPANIFENPSKIPVTDTLLQQAKTFLDNFRKITILFRDKIFHDKLIRELQHLIVDIQNELVHKVKLLKSLNCFAGEGKDKTVCKINERHNYMKPVDRLKPMEDPKLKINLQGSSELAEIKEKIANLSKTNNASINTKYASHNTSSVTPKCIGNNPNIALTAVNTNILTQTSDSVPITVNTQGNTHYKTSNDTLQTSHGYNTSKTNINRSTDKRIHDSVLDTILACNEEIKRRKISYLSLDQVNKNVSPLLKEGGNVLKIKYTKPVLPTGTITLESLIGKKMPDSIDIKRGEECQRRIIDDADGVHFTKIDAIADKCNDDQVGEERVRSKIISELTNIECSCKDDQIEGDELSVSEKTSNSSFNEDAENQKHLQTYDKTYMIASSDVNDGISEPIDYENVGSVVKKGCG